MTIIRKICILSSCLSGSSILLAIVSFIIKGLAIGSISSSFLALPECPPSVSSSIAVYRCSSALSLRYPSSKPTHSHFSNRIPAVIVL